MLLDPGSMIGSAVGAGSGVGLLIRIGGFVGRYILNKDKEKTTREAIRHNQITQFQSSVDTATVETKEIDVSNHLEWKIGNWIVLSRKWTSKGKKPLFTLRQHAISYTIYCFVSIIGLCTFLFIDNPDRILLSINPSSDPRTWSIFWGLITYTLPSETPFQISTGGIGWSMLAAELGLISLLTVGLAGSANK